VPLWPTIDHVDQEHADPLTLLLYPAEGSGQATLYEDAGDGYEQENGVYARRTITCAVEAGQIHVVMSEQEGTFIPARQRIRLELREISATPASVWLGATPATWHYHPEQHYIVVDLEETAQAIDLTIQF
jgi:alpha-glucosidase